jgi:hypothetical protein
VPLGRRADELLAAKADAASGSVCRDEIGTNYASTIFVAWAVVASAEVSDRFGSISDPHGLSAQFPPGPLRKSRPLISTSRPRSTVVGASFCSAMLSNRVRWRL